MFRFLINWKLLAGVVVVCAILAVALWPRTIEVDVAHVSRGDLLLTIDEEGETRVRQRFIIATPVAGRLQRIELEPGDRVVRGRPVARLMPGAPALLDARMLAELGAGLGAAEAALGQARADRQRAASTLDRSESLLARRQELAGAGVISRDQLEADEADMKVAQEELRAADYAVEQAEQELEMARVRLQQPATSGRTIDITAQTDGVVLKRYRESESDVSAGEPLLEIGNTADLEIVSDLLSTDAVRVSPGDRVLIEAWGGGTPLEGRVRRVEPAAFMKVSALGVEEQRVNVIIDFEKPDGKPQELGDGYRVEVRIIVSEVNAAVKVPIGSLFRRGETWAVFTIENDRARLRNVQPGQRNDLEAEILTELAEGQLVIVHPPDSLTEDARVSVRTTMPATLPVNEEIDSPH
jgi:HlyD family secretion protein